MSSRHVGFFVLFMLACADVVSVPIAGGNFRLFYLAALLGLAFTLRTLRMNGELVLRFAVLVACLVPSIVFGIDPSRSLLYLAWVVLTFVCTFGLFGQLTPAPPSAARGLDREALYDALVQIYRVQIVVALALYAVGVHERPQFLYYEPSYFSISLALYCAFVAHRLRKGRGVMFDVFLIAAYLLTSASGAFVLVLSLTALLNVSLRRLTYVISGAVLAIAASATYFYSVDDVNTALVRSVLSGDVDAYEILLRGGNRLARMLAARDLFIDNPGRGIGLGNFELATKIFDVDNFAENQDWLSNEGKPAINIYLEILATTGLIGFLGFCIFFLPLFRWMFGAGYASPLSRGVICMLLLLTWESNFLRPYLWVGMTLCWIEYRQAILALREPARRLARRA